MTKIKMIRRYHALEREAKAIARRGVYSTMEYNPYDEISSREAEMAEIAEELGWSMPDEDEEPYEPDFDWFEYNNTEKGEW